MKTYVLVIGIQAAFSGSCTLENGATTPAMISREPDSERYSTLCWSSGQVRKNDAILVGSLGQHSLDRMLPIPPCRSTLRAEREARIFSTDAG